MNAEKIKNAPGRKCNCQSPSQSLIVLGQRLKVSTVFLFFTLFVELALPIAFAAEPSFRETWMMNAINTTGDELNQWSISNLGNGDPKEIKVVESNKKRVLRFEPSNEKLLGVETNGQFPLTNDITFCFVVALREDSPDKGEAVIFLQDSENRSNRIQVNLQKNFVQLGTSRNGSFEVLQAKTANISPDGTKILLKMKTAESGCQQYEIWVDDAEIISASLNPESRVSFGGNVKISLLSQGGGKVDFGAVTISDGVASKTTL